MKCKKCGNNLLKKDKYCKRCGAETPFLGKLDNYYAIMAAIPLIYLLFIIYALVYKEDSYIRLAYNGVGLVIEIDCLYNLLRNNYKKKQTIITFIISLIFLTISFFITF